MTYPLFQEYILLVDVKNKILVYRTIVLLQIFQAPLKIIIRNNIDHQQENEKTLNYPKKTIDKLLQRFLVFCTSKSKTIEVKNQDYFLDLYMFFSVFK